MHHVFFQPNVNVLSYAPGPLLTDMYEEIRTTCGNQEVVDMFNTSKEQVSTDLKELLFKCANISAFQEDKSTRTDNAYKGTLQAHGDRDNLI